MLGIFKDFFRPRRTIEQHIAVFGESGSGKTTLLSTFYGWHQEPAFRKKAGYSLTAQDTTQGQRLSSRYLQMKQNHLPDPTRYQHQEFKFNINVRGLKNSAGSLVWHDYPGEWWEETKYGSEATKKIEAFRSLLQSDVAFFLCDAQRLNNEGARYIRGLFRNFRDEIERQGEKLHSENNPLRLFPRIWIICLSKSDLIPDKDVYWFRDEVHKAASDELDELREVFKGLVENNEYQSYQSIGEDFLLLSSAQFNVDTGKIENPDQHVGIDLIPPISIILPIEKALRWARTREVSHTAVYRLTEVFRSLTTNWMKYIPVVGNAFMIADDTAQSITAKLKELEDSAREKGDSVEAVVAAFRGKLENENAQNIYFSNKNEIR